MVSTAYFDIQRQAFAEAVDRLGECAPVHFHLAGTGFTIRSAGAALTETRWFRALEHLRVETPDPDSWNIFAWDDQEADWTWRIPESEFAQGMQTNHLPKLSSESIRVFHQDWLGVYSAINRETREAFYVPEEVSRIPSCERAAPMRTILNFLLNEKGFQMVHAAAIALSNGTSLLLPGSGGSGKSTTAFRWITQGHRYQGDDLCAIGGTDKIETIAVYQSAKLRSTSESFFPELSSPFERIEEFGEEKLLFHLDEMEGDILIERAAAVGIVLPQIGREAKTIWGPAKPMEVMKAVIPQTTLQVPKSDNRGGSIMMDVIARLSAWKVELGTDPDDLISTLEGFFSGDV